MHVNNMTTAAQSKVDLIATLKPGHGVKEDFNAFVHHFTEKNTLRYENFSELWKELQMPYIFAGRMDYELREAIEYAYTAALDIFSSGTNIQAKTCAVYLLYAAYETQALFPKTRIRVTATQFNAFVTFVEEMASKQHYDFVFVFNRLRMQRAFLYVATAEPLGKPKKNKAVSARVKEVLPTSLVSTFSDLSLELIEDLAVVNEEYYRVKCVATNPTTQSTAPHPSLDLARPDFISDVTRQVARFDNWRKTGKWKKKIVKRKSAGGVTTSESEGDNASDSDSAPDHAEESIVDKRQKIRRKAFGTISRGHRSTRYRKMVGESSQSDGALYSPVKPRRSTRSRQPKKNPIQREAEDLANTNKHLMMATAPSKKEQRRRRVAQRRASRKLSQAEYEGGDESN